MEHSVDSSMYVPGVGATIMLNNVSPKTTDFHTEPVKTQQIMGGPKLTHPIQINQQTTPHQSAVLTQIPEVVQATPHKLPSPVKFNILQQYLTGYDVSKLALLQTGFTQGFSLQHQGIRTFRDSKNLRSAEENPQILQQKIDKEVSLGRIAGPFDSPPFQNFHISPLGLVPKKEKNEFRLIHHLSYPSGFSINDGISSEDSSVQYQNISDAIGLVKYFGPGTLLAKTDIENAFRILPISPNDYELLGMKIAGKYYFDRVLPMGCSISCNLFEQLSTALHWAMENHFQAAGVVHVLDDFLFAGPPNSEKGRADLVSFLALCQRVGIPIKHSKTVQPTTTITFLGVEIDSIAMEARLPQEKVEKVKALLSSFSSRKKVTLKELQSLIGLLNFACCVVLPGRPFLRRLIDLTKGIVKPHFHIRLNREARLDIHAWQQFINSFNGVSLILADRWETSNHLHFYTDASGLGFGAVFNEQWFYGEWPEAMMSHHITIKELFPIVIAVEIWGEQLKHKCILFHSDNDAVVSILNKHSSKDPVVMKLVRRLVVKALQLNILFCSEHIMGKRNILADALSRLQVQTFRELAPHMKRNPVLVPAHLLLI
ncbi:uncharacterized protein LOC117326910 isoform X1 [Pecten maximus]|uniref:uncharacterized protein LOC117326910 isoform X1 n=1 Tax=Pecten maximus TaxID=6579 RepID=UPI001458062E|nr:uncharacterized protein LOC117326910 isoform X1 [Pecten maximus]